MRTFSTGSGMDRKFVILEVHGPRMRVTQGMSDGNTRRSEKELGSEAEARSACERMAGELISRGFVEQSASGPARVKPARPTASAPKTAARAVESAPIDAGHVFEDLAEVPGEEEVVLPRLAGSAPPAAEAVPGKKKKVGGKKKKKGKKAEGGDGLDKRVIAGFVATGAVLVAFLGYLGYEIFLKPPSIVGTWQGSKLEHEVGRFLTHTQYRLILDDRNRASLTLQEKFTSTGTYAVQGDRLKITLKDEDGETSEVRYQVSLGRTTLDLFDPESGKKVVQLIRFREKPSVGDGAPPPTAPAPKDLAAGAVDKAADDRLASVEFAPKDGAFKLRHPPGWEAETGSRPDNTYSWARFSRGSARIQVFADIAGSLASGSDLGRQEEEGSASAPVHAAHEMYQRTASEEYSNYKESEPGLFQGSPLGEGRVATFTASGGGLSGTRLRGYRVTLLTNDRRVSVLCTAPEGDFEKLRPTFLAVCRSVSR